MAFMFTKSQLGGWRGYWGLSTSGNCCIDVNKDMVNPACVQSCPTGAAIRVRPEYFRQVEFL
jgi:Fe-S-cluster-containing dehydrogenase component